MSQIFCISIGGGQGVGRGTGAGWRDSDWVEGQRLGRETGAGWRDRG